MRSAHLTTRVKRWAGFTLCATLACACDPGDGLGEVAVGAEVESPVRFGVASVGSVVSKSARLRATGTGPVHLVAVTSPNPAFTVPLEGVETVGPGASLAIPIRWAPTESGTYVASLSVELGHATLAIEVSGTAESGCDDGNPCTTDTFDASTATCVSTPRTGACDDGNECTTSDQCVDGVCVGTSELCDDGVACTQDSCHDTLGCISTPRHDLCPAASNPCEVGVCDGFRGCITVTAPNGTECGAPVCSERHVCWEGACVPIPVTADVAAKLGCPYRPQPARPQIATGAGFTCVILEGGDVVCFGLNSHGQLGVGHTENLGDDPGELGTELARVELGENFVAVAVVAGVRYACALSSEGAIKCWGDAPGYGDTAIRGDEVADMGTNLDAIDLGTGRSALAVSVGMNTTCAVLDNHRVKCWGENYFATLGAAPEDWVLGDEAGEMGDALEALELGSGFDAIDVTVGAFHVCALSTTGLVKCWGSNTLGACGAGCVSAAGVPPFSMGNALPALQIDASRAVLAIDAGYSHTCALLEDATVKCWGSGGFGQHGAGASQSVGGCAYAVNDVGVVDLAGQRALSVTAGGFDTCVRLGSGHTRCWGGNCAGSLGYGDTQVRGTHPNHMGSALADHQLALSTPAEEIAPGFGYVFLPNNCLAGHTCARAQEGELKCWGINSSGELGLGGGGDRGDSPGEMGEALPHVALP